MIDLLKIPAELAGTHDRLVNWGRWARPSRGGGATTCASAERAYRPDRLTEGEEAERRRASMPVDAADASLVDRAIAPASGFPARLSLLLKLAYVYPAGRFEAARRAAVPYRELDQHLMSALYAARNRLARRAGSCQNSSDNLKPTSVVESRAMPCSRTSATSLAA